MKNKEQKMQQLNRLLHRGVIKNERDFMLFYGFCDNMLTSHKAPHTVIMEIHLFEGYCQLEVKVNPFCKYSSSFKAFYEHSNNLTIFFYNYYDQPVCSYEVLQNRYMITAKPRLEKRFVGEIMTIEELDKYCRNKEHWESGKTFADFLREGAIPYEGYIIKDKRVGESLIHFNVLEDYAPIENPEEYIRLKDVHVQITEVEIRG